MNDQRPFDEFEERLQETARSFSYPPTPDIAGRVRQQVAEKAAPSVPQRQRRRLQLAWVALLLIVLASVLAVPEVRATILRILRVGSVEIVVTTPTPSGGTATASIATATPPQQSPAPSPTLLPSLLHLAGETTLQEARSRFPSPIRLPSHPPDLGPPDRVYLQDLDGPAVILVWLDQKDSDNVRMSLHILTEAVLAYKKMVRWEQLAETIVHNQRAIWVQGEHLVELTRQGRVQYQGFTRLVEGNTLIWTEGSLTYRLETGLSMEQAVQIAESLR